MALLRLSSRLHIAGYHDGLKPCALVGDFDKPLVPPADWQEWRSVESLPAMDGLAGASLTLEKWGDETFASRELDLGFDQQLGPIPLESNEAILSRWKTGPTPPTALSAFTLAPASSAGGANLELAEFHCAGNALVTITDRAIRIAFGSTIAPGAEHAARYEGHEGSAVLCPDAYVVTWPFEHIDVFGGSAGSITKSMTITLHDAKSNATLLIQNATPAITGWSAGFRNKLEEMRVSLLNAIATSERCNEHRRAMARSAATDPGVLKELTGKHFGELWLIDPTSIAENAVLANRLDELRAAFKRRPANSAPVTSRAGIES